MFLSPTLVNRQHPLITVSLVHLPFCNVEIGIVMSRHVYGRHGPDAWRRWHERRFRRAPSHVAFVFLRVPPTIERVVLILMSEQHEEHINLPSTGQMNVIPGSLPQATDAIPAYNRQPSEPQDRVAVMSNDAHLQGMKQGQEDRKKHDICDQGELEDKAMRAAIDYLENPAHRHLMAYDSTKNTERFSERYQEGYLYGAKLQSLEDLPSPRTRMVQQQAHRDRERDESKGDALAEDPLLAQAIRYALELIGQRSPETKQRVVEDVSIYLEAYRSHIPERQAQPERSSFRSSSIY
jgi:hypothetical protein